MELTEKLKSMTGKTWMYKARLQKLLSFKIKEDSVTLVTDKEWYEIPITKINKELTEFLVAGQDSNQMELILFKSNGKQSLKDLIYENIDKIKANPSYITQAKELNSQVKTILEMAKIQLLMDRGKGK